MVPMKPGEAKFKLVLAGEVTCHLINLTDLTVARISAEQTRSEQEVT